jgi:hypothetical protein
MGYLNSNLKKQAYVFNPVQFGETEEDAPQKVKFYYDIGQDPEVAPIGGVVGGVTGVTVGALAGRALADKLGRDSKLGAILGTAAGGLGGHILGSLVDKYRKHRKERMLAVETMLGLNNAAANGKPLNFDEEMAWADFVAGQGNEDDDIYHHVDNRLSSLSKGYLTNQDAKYVQDMAAQGKLDPDQWNAAVDKHYAKVLNKDKSKKKKKSKK